MILLAASAIAQVEMVPPSHPVYEFLKRMQIKEIIPDYNSASIPLSRQKIADYLKVIELRARGNDKSMRIDKFDSKILSSTDNKLLNDYNVEFEFDIRKTTSNSSNLLSFKSFDVFKDNKQKYIYYYTDSNAAFFLDGIGNLSYRGSEGDSIGKNSISLGELGFRIRGTLFDRVGFYLRASNGQKLSGDTKDRVFAYNTDVRLKANTKFVTEGKNFDSFEGYLRYSTQGEWLALTAGREAIYSGFGYIDRLFLSNNTVPFDALKLDLKYKAISYQFLYGNLKGDSLGRDLASKNIASHRFDVRLGNRFRFGITESIIISDNFFSFTYLNPISFLMSADLNKGVDETLKNNSLMGFDFEVVPVDNLAVQGSFLIDDLNLSTLSNNDASNSDNKFGYQAGLLWTDAFTLPNLTAAVEYTRLDPFVYSHRTNKSTYTNWGMSLGHALPPNSDEIATKFTYWVGSRLRMDLTYQHQRSGAGFLFDSAGAMIQNYGGDINLGSHDFNETKNTFLQGNRVNRDIIGLNVSWQPIRQWYLELKYNYSVMNLLYLNSKKVIDRYWFVTLRVDY